MQTLESALKDLGFQESKITKQKKERLINFCKCGAIVGKDKECKICNKKENILKRYKILRDDEYSLEIEFKLVDSHIYVSLSKNRHPDQIRIIRKNIDNISFLKELGILIHQSITYPDVKFKNVFNWIDALNYIGVVHISNCEHSYKRKKMYKWEKKGLKTFKKGD